jgi:hypothetical protein
MNEIQERRVTTRCVVSWGIKKKKKKNINAREKRSEDVERKGEQYLSDRAVCQTVIVS